MFLFSHYFFSLRSLYSTERSPIQKQGYTTTCVYGAAEEVAIEDVERDFSARQSSIFSQTCSSRHIEKDIRANVEIKRGKNLHHAAKSRETLYT